MNDKVKEELDTLARELAVHLVDHPTPEAPECPVCQAVENHVSAWNPDVGLATP